MIMDDTDRKITYSIRQRDQKYTMSLLVDNEEKKLCPLSDLACLWSFSFSLKLYDSQETDSVFDLKAIFNTITFVFVLYVFLT